jgi:hypothetical protein
MILVKDNSVNLGEDVVSAAVKSIRANSNVLKNVDQANDKDQTSVSGEVVGNLLKRT